MFAKILNDLKDLHKMSTRKKTTTAKRVKTSGTKKVVGEKRVKKPVKKGVVCTDVTLKEIKENPKYKLIEGFTKRYNLTQLVYFESTSDIQSALEYEKKLKNWHREWKMNLIESTNKEWLDLSFLRYPEINSG